MKNNLTPASTQTKHQEVEYLLETKEQEINQSAKLEGMDLASAGRPTDEDTNLGIFTNGITTAWATVLEKTHQILGAHNASSQGGELKVSLNIEKAELENQLPSLYEEIRVEQMKIREYDNSLEAVFKNWKFAKVGILVVIFGELLINFKAFDLLTGSNTLFSFIGALAVGVVLFAMSLFQHRVLVQVRHKVKRWIFTIGISLLVLIMLYGLAELRFTYINIMDEGISKYLTPKSFVVISFLFYLGGVVLAVLFYPSEEQRKAREMFLSAQSVIDQIHKEIDQTKARILEIPKELSKKLSYYYSVLVMTRNYERRIESLHQYSLSLFIKTNLSYRRGKTPNIFLGDMPELDKQFTNILNQ